MNSRACWWAHLLSSDWPTQERFPFLPLRDCPAVGCLSSVGALLSYWICSALLGRALGRSRFLQPDSPWSTASCFDSWSGSSSEFVPIGPPGPSSLALVGIQISVPSARGASTGMSCVRGLHPLTPSFRFWMSYGSISKRPPMSSSVSSSAQEYSCPQPSPLAGSSIASVGVGSGMRSSMSSTASILSGRAVGKWSLSGL